MNALPRAAELEPMAVIMHRVPERELVRQHSPRAAGAVEVEGAVDHFPHVHRAVTTTRLGGRDQRLNDRPLPIGQVRWVRHPCHTTATSAQIGAYHTLSHRVRPAFNVLSGLRDLFVYRTSNKTTSADCTMVRVMLGIERKRLSQMAARQRFCDRPRIP